MLVPLSSKYPDWLTKSQVKACDFGLEWYNDRTDLEPFRLKGPAGTGKTTVIKTLINNLPKNTRVAITAPTHKACRIAGSMTNLTAVTIPKLLGFRLNTNIEDFNPANIKFDPLGKVNLDGIEALIVDEASMLGNRMKEYLERKCRDFGTKCIYVGDPYQLPPIKERYSSAFDAPPGYTIELDEVVRQAKGNRTIELLEILRYSIRKKNFDYLNFLFKNTKSFNNGVGFMLTNDIDEFGSYMKTAFNSPELEKNVDFVKYLAFTNDNIRNWNKYIRDCIFPNHNTDIIISDDLFTSYNTLVDDFSAPIITNSEDYIIKEMVKYTNKYGIEGYLVRFVEVATGTSTQNLFVVDHTAPTYERFLNIARDKIKYASNAMPGVDRTSKWNDYYEFKNENLLLNDVNREDAYGKIIKEIPKDIDFGYGLTIHKSQGSTYKHVFVNLKDIIYRNGDVPSGDVDMINRLSYVAFSRSSESLFIYY